MEINCKLEEYINNQIIPEYNKNETAHGIEHIEYVINRSLKLAKKYNLNLDIAYTIAAYHDIGHHIDAKNHEKVSADIFYHDEYIHNFFNDDEITVIKEAIEDHRAYSKNDPRSIYGKIVSDADKNTEVEIFFKRSIIYTFKYYPNYSKEQCLERVYNHCIEKFGEEGYAKLYLEDEKYEEYLKSLRNLIKNKTEFKNMFETIYKQIV